MLMMLIMIIIIHLIGHRSIKFRDNNYHKRYMLSNHFLLNILNVIVHVPFKQSVNWITFYVAIRFKRSRLIPFKFFNASSTNCNFNETF